VSAVWAVLIHGALAVFIVAPLLWRSRHRIPYSLLAFVGGSALDIDHFIEAGTLNLHKIETLPGGRPETHSIAFVLLLALLTFVACPRSWALDRRLVAAWAMFAVNMGHILFDGAGGGEQILYPWNQVDGIPWLLCPIGAVLLFLASAAIARRSSRASPDRALEPLAP
jgi:hypothetical protein